jgi:hypothetical protein
MPDEDAVIAITSETADMQGELNLVWKYLLPAMHPQALPANPAEDAALRQHLAALNLPPLSGTGSGANPDINNKTFVFKPNALGIKSISFNVAKHICHVRLRQDSATYLLNFASGKWLPGSTDMQGPSLLLGAKEDFSFLAPYKVDGSYGFEGDSTVQFKLRYIESPHTEIITCNFNGPQLNATAEYSFSYGKNKIELQGEEVK